MSGLETQGMETSRLRRNRRSGVRGVFSPRVEARPGSACARSRVRKSLPLLLGAALAASSTSWLTIGAAQDPKAPGGAPEATRGVQPSPGAMAFPRRGIVTGNRVSVRCGPSLNHHSLGTLPAGSELIVTAARGEWLEMMLPPYMKCWISGDHVREVAGGASGEATPRVVVTGSKVNLRSTPNTTYTPIGAVLAQTVLEPTGRRDAGGEWIEIMAPREARVYMHGRHIRLGPSVPLADVPHLFRRLRPPAGELASPSPRAGRGATEARDDLGKPTPAAATPRESGGAERSSAPAGAGKGGGTIRPPELPAVVSPRLRSLYESLRQELQQSAILWSFDKILAELRGIERTSEDLGERQLARVWATIIREKYQPISDGLVRAERNRKSAREREAAGANRERGIPEAVRPIPKAPAKYLAKGWVVAMGKNSKTGGTHKLMKGNKLLFYLKSEKINLDRFVYRRVGVQGILRDLPDDVGGRLIEVTALEQLSR